MEAQTTTPRLDLAEVSSRYLGAWEAGDVAKIADLHTDTSRFQIHVAGSEPALGRDAVRDAFAAVLAQWPNFATETRRLLLGTDHWVLDYTLSSSGGEAGDVRFGCVDIVTVSAEGLVDRKDTYVDMGELSAAMGQS